MIKDIGVGKQQLVEIAKALAKNAKLLILDEPTASLNEDDSKALLEPVSYTHLRDRSCSYDSGKGGEIRCIGFYWQMTRELCLIL